VSLVLLFCSGSCYFYIPTEIDLVLANFLILPHFFVCVNLNQAVLVTF